MKQILFKYILKSAMTNPRPNHKTLYFVEPRFTNTQSHLNIENTQTQVKHNRTSITQTPGLIFQICLKPQGFSKTNGYIFL